MEYTVEARQVKTLCFEVPLTELRVREKEESHAYSAIKVQEETQ
jgi:hypothetical protein